MLTTHILLREIGAAYGYGLGLAIAGCVGFYVLIDHLGGGGVSGVVFAYLGYLVGSVWGAVAVGQALGAPGSLAAAAAMAVAACAAMLWPTRPSSRGLDTKVVLKITLFALVPALVALAYNASALLST